MDGHPGGRARIAPLSQRRTARGTAGTANGLRKSAAGGAANIVTRASMGPSVCRRSGPRRGAGQADFQFGRGGCFRHATGETGGGGRIDGPGRAEWGARLAQCLDGRCRVCPKPPPPRRCAAGEGAGGGGIFESSHGGAGWLWVGAPIPGLSFSNLAATKINGTITRCGRGPGKTEQRQNRPGMVAREPPSLLDDGQWDCQCTGQVTGLRNGGVGWGNCRRAGNDDRNTAAGHLDPAAVR